jgi:hypothetical protein
LPRSPEGNTYIVSFPEYPDEAAALLFPRPDIHGQYDASTSLLYLYHRGLFTEADDVYSLSSLKKPPTLTRIDFETIIPNPPPSGKTPKIQLVWTIEKMDKDTIVGVQSKVGQSPRRYIARLSVSSQTDAKSVARK